MGELEEFQRLLERSSLGSPKAVEARRIGVAIESVNLLNLLVERWRAGDVKADQQIGCLLDQLEQRWPPT